MASAIYAKAKEAFLQADIDMGSANIKASLVDATDYTPNDSADDFYNDVSAGVEEASANMASKDFTEGTFDADDVTWSSTSGDACDYIIIWEDTGTPTTSHLIIRLESDQVTGLPVTLGGDVTCEWDSDGIFTL